MINIDGFPYSLTKLGNRLDLITGRTSITRSFLFRAKSTDLGGAIVKKWQAHFLTILGVLYLLVSVSFTGNVKAKNQIAQVEEVGILFPYEGKTYYITDYAHYDGLGGYVGGVANYAAVDFTHYSGGEKVNCGEPTMSPHSGELTFLGKDSHNVTIAVIKGTRHWSFFMHGDFVPDGYLKQGDIFGYENTHGDYPDYSTACHWHWSMWDTVLNSWVNPLTLESVGVPAGAGQVVTLDIAKIKVELPTTVVVADNYLEGLFSSTPTSQPTFAENPTTIAVTTPTPESNTGTTKVVTVTNPQTGEPIGSWKIDWSKIPFRVNTARAKEIWAQHGTKIILVIVLLLVLSIVFRKPTNKGQTDETL